MKKLITLFATVLLYTAAGAQSAKVTYSDPIDIPATGYNKVLQVRNGNTLLFHMEPYKGIVVKVFDKSHKEIASQKHTCEIVDINTLNLADFKGLFDINGEAVLFIQQPYMSRMSLMRLRIDATTGKLLKEEVVERAPTFKNETIFYVQQFPGKDQYAILHYKNQAFMPDEKMKISIWNGKNEKLREASIDKPFPELSTMHYNGFNAEKGAVYASFSLYIQIANGQYKQYLYTARMNENDTVCTTQNVEVDDRIPSYFSVFTPNEFAETENMMAMNMYASEEKVGENKETAYFPVPYFFSFAKDFSVASSGVIEEDKIREKTVGMRDTMAPSAWIPQAMHTSKTGASSVFYEMQHDYFKHEKGKDFHQTYLGHFAVNMLDDNGTSFFSVVIPKKQILYSLYTSEDLSRRNTTRHLFREAAAEDHNSQFASFEVLPAKGSYNIVVNDLVENFDKKITDSLKTVVNFDYTNAVCYTLNRKRELTKSYLFGAPTTADEAKPCQLESAFYDEATGLYAVVMQERKDNKTSIKIAWCQFEPSI